MRLPSAPKQLHQAAHFGRLEMVELLAMTFDHLRGDFVEQRDAGWRNSDQHDAAVISRPLTIDQAAFDQPIEQACDVRRAGDEPGGKAQGLHALRVGGAEEPHRVVLLGGDAVLLEELVFEEAEAIVSTPEIKKDFLLG
jgi:hypothetical protein